jgi:hypothetical protein
MTFLAPAVLTSARVGLDVAPYACRKQKGREMGKE